MPKKPTELSDPISLRLPVDLLGEVEKVAEACERPRSWVIVRALRHYLDNEGADVLAIAEGMEQMRRGEVYDAEEVLRELNALAADDKAA